MVFQCSHENCCCKITDLEISNTPNVLPIQRNVPKHIIEKEGKKKEKGKEKSNIFQPTARGFYVSFAGKTNVGLFCFQILVVISCHDHLLISPTTN